MIVNNEDNIPDKIYKYVDCRTAKIIISDSTLKFTQPSEFNDVLDCHISGIYFDLSGVIDDSVRNDFEELKKGYPDLTINDLLEGYEFAQKKKIENSAVTCFSLAFNNQALWGYYADKHTGVCLEFDFSFPKELQFPTISKLTQGHVQYHFKEPFNYCESKFYGIVRLFMSKSADWEHEQEFRMLTHQGAGIYRFDPFFLTKVIFGSRTSIDAILEITNVCKALGMDHIQFEHAQIDGNQLTYKALN